MYVYQFCMSVCLSVERVWQMRKTSKYPRISKMGLVSCVNEVIIADYNSHQGRRDAVVRSIFQMN